MGVDEGGLEVRRCPTCDTEYSSVRKFNNGNGGVFELPNCDCEADRICDDFLARLARRREAK